MNVVEQERKKSKYRVPSIFLAIVAVLALGSLIFYRPESERLYKGKPESFWVNTLNAKFSTPFFDAVGTNAVPVLLKAVEKRDNSGKRFYRHIWPLIPTRLRQRLPYPSDPSAVRTNAAMILMNTADAKTLATLLQSHFDPTVRYLAANGLILRRNPELTSILIKCLNDSDANVRRALILAIGSSCKDETIAGPVFASCLQDTDAEVRAWAGTSLLSFSNGVGLAVSEIRKAVTNSDPQIRRAASDAVVKNSDEEIVQAFQYNAQLLAYEERSPKWTATIKVIDEASKPIERATVKVYYSLPSSPTEKFLGTNISGLSDKNGIFVGAKKTSSADLLFEASKEGYYKSQQSYELAFTQNPLKLSPTQTLVLRKIISPTPMYVIRADIVHEKKPALDVPVGFDLFNADWVAPYGKGTNADLFFTCHATGDTKTGWDETLTVTFPNQGDGIQEFESKPSSAFAQIEFHSPYVAPEAGYRSEVTKLRSWYPNRPGTNSYSANKNYLLRVRTRLDENGNVKQAIYGKIYGDFDSTFLILLNPELNSRNIESDPFRNFPRDPAWPKMTVGQP